MTSKTSLFALALLLGTTSAEATLARVVSFDEKVESSNTIFIGRCTKTESRWDDQHRWILTSSTFAVEKSWKGATVNELTIVTPGGVVDGIHQDSIGIPTFNKGDENVVFVRNTDVGPTVSFASQGAYVVAKDEHGDRIVQPMPSQAVIIDTQRGVAVAPEEPRTLAQFETEVRQAIRRGAQNRMEMTRPRVQKRQADFSPLTTDSKGLIALALAGMALALAQFTRRR
ncbi:MAG TPA: hypothetical protein VMU84_13800 [Thermoanaerobaculia bacterium]|nr:hypothetical protein [Thermoanaerobaculia bacterium]